MTTAASGGSGQYLGCSSPVSHPPRPAPAPIAAARPPGPSSLRTHKRRFPAASRQRGPADQLPPPNPGLISGIQATDELRTRGPAPQGSGWRCRGDTGPRSAEPGTLRAPGPAHSTAGRSESCWHPTTSWENRVPKAGRIWGQPQLPVAHAHMIPDFCFRTPRADVSAGQMSCSQVIRLSLAF